MLYNFRIFRLSDQKLPFTPLNENKLGQIKGPQKKTKGENLRKMNTEKCNANNRTPNGDG